MPATKTARGRGRPPKRGNKKTGTSEDGSPIVTSALGQDTVAEPVLLLTSNGSSKDSQATKVGTPSPPFSAPANSSSAMSDPAFQMPEDLLERFHSYSRKFDEMAHSTIMNMLAQPQDEMRDGKKDFVIPPLVGDKRERARTDYYTKIWLSTIPSHEKWNGIHHQAIAKEYVRIFDEMDKNCMMKDSELDAPSKQLQQAAYEHFIANPAQLIGSDNAVSGTRMTLLDQVLNRRQDHLEQLWLDGTQKDQNLKNAVVDDLLHSLENDSHPYIQIDLGDCVVTNEDNFSTLDYWTLKSMPFVNLSQETSSPSTESNDGEVKSPATRSSPLPQHEVERAAMVHAQPLKPDSSVKPTAVKIVAPLVDPSEDALMEARRSQDKAAAVPVTLADSSPADTVRTGRYGQDEDSPLIRKLARASAVKATSLLNFNPPPFKDMVKSPLMQTQLQGHGSEDGEASERYATPMDQSSESEKDESGEISKAILQLEQDEIDLVMGDAMAPSVIESSRDNVTVGREPLTEMPTNVEKSAAKLTIGKEGDILTLAKERIKNALEKPLSRKLPAFASVLAKEVQDHKLRKEKPEDRPIVSVDTAIAHSVQPSSPPKLSPTVLEPVEQSVEEVTNPTSRKSRPLTPPVQPQEAPQENGRELTAAGKAAGSPKTAIAPREAVQANKKQRPLNVAQPPLKKIVVSVTGAAKKAVAAQAREQKGDVRSSVSKFKIQLPEQKIQSSSAAQSTQMAEFRSIQGTSPMAVQMLQQSEQYPISSSTPPGSPPEIYDSDMSDRPDQKLAPTPEWAKHNSLMQLLENQHKKMPNLGGRMASTVNMKELLGKHLPRGESPFERAR